MIWWRRLHSYSTKQHHHAIATRNKTFHRHRGHSSAPSRFVASSIGNNNCRHRATQSAINAHPFNFQNRKVPINRNCHPLSTSANTSKQDKETHQAKPLSIAENLHILKDIPLEDCRNFCFIAHVDHGKSSLASRVLELTGNLGSEQQVTALSHAAADNSNGDDNEDIITENEQSKDSTSPQLSPGKKEEIEILDSLSVERERGITVKASAASMLYPHPTATNKHGVLLLNMVDTPGHADFGTEVTRSLLCIEAAILLFDAAQGVQAQSLSVFEKTKRLENVKRVIPALTKVDLPAARPLEVALSVSELFGFDPDDVLLTSARSRLGIVDVIEKVCCDVPAPMALPDDDGKTLRVKIIDSWFEPLRGVICLVQILSGELTEGIRVSIVEPAADDVSGDGGSSSGGHKFNPKDHYSVQDIGLVLPRRLRTGRLSHGQMGYCITGLRDPRQAKPGAIMVQNSELNRVVTNMYLPAPPRSDISSSQSVLYASVHPMEGDGFDELSAAVDKLALNDTGLEIHRTAGNSSSDGGPFLGPGLRVGFQGLLHVEVFQQRLLDEFHISAIVTPPKVPYRIHYLSSKNQKLPADLPETEIIEDLSKWPHQGFRFTVEEPFVDVRIMAPMDCAGNIMDLIKRKRGKGMETKPIDELTWLFTACMPWGEVVTDFHDELKNCSAGYASFDSSEAENPFQESKLCKVDIVLNGESVDPLAFVCHKEDAQHQGRIVCKKLQEVLPRQQFVTVIQAKADSKIIASERIRAYRKDVLTTGGSKAVGGGDITRKKKLLEKQKRGKKRQQTGGKVRLTQAAFNSVISRSS